MATFDPTPVMRILWMWFIFALDVGIVITILLKTIKRMGEEL